MSPSVETALQEIPQRDAEEIACASRAGAFPERQPEQRAVRFVRGLKVCIISPLGYGLYRSDLGLPFGGAELQLQLLATSLSQDPSCAVTVLTTVDGEPGEEQYGPIRLIKRQGGHRTASLKGAGFFGLVKLLRRYASAYAEMKSLFLTIDADLYVHAGTGAEIGVYAWLCRGMGKRFVFVVASTADLDHTYGTATGPFRWLSPLGIRWADAVVCRTRDQQALLKQRYGRTGILIRSGHPIPRAPSSVLSPQHSQSSLLWIGRLHAVKQPEKFLDLAERVPDQPCIMIGMRDATHEELARAVARRAAALSNVMLVQDVPQGQVDEYVRGAKLLVNTSIYEGFSNTFVQAAMAGVPVCSLNVDPDGLLSRQEIGLCAGGNEELLAASVRSLLSSDRRRAELGRRAATYARAHHDLRRTTEDFKRLAQNLVYGRAERRR